jgi:hypothetical protein
MVAPAIGCASESRLHLYPVNKEKLPAAARAPIPALRKCARENFTPAAQLLYQYTQPVPFVNNFFRRLTSF